jgi:hypothetical protein
MAKGTAQRVQGDKLPALNKDSLRNPVLSLGDTYWRQPCRMSGVKYLEVLRDLRNTLCGQNRPMAKRGEQDGKEKIF